MKIILLILINIIEISSYILPQTFREWTIIGIDKNINNQKPYHYKIGNLPMVLWYNKSNPQTIINSCNKHLGNTLKNSYIINDELICPFHKKSYTNDDNLGEIQKRNGLIWWSYKSFKKHPPKINDENNNYHIEVKNDFISIILNLICDFNGEDDTYKFHKKKLLIKKDRDYIIYKYPYTLIFNNKYMINVIPIDENKSHFYITILKTNYINEYELNKFKTYIENRYNDFRFKYLLLGESNTYINKVYKLYNEYMFPNDITIKYFLTNKRYY